MQADMPGKGITPKEAKRPPLWSAFLVLALPFIPVAVALGAYRLGLSRGCPPFGADACIVSGFDLGEVIQIAMAAAWLIIFGVFAPVLVATSIVHRSLEGFGPRFAFGGLLPAILAVTTVITPTMAAALMKAPKCSLRDPGTDCIVFGKGMEQAFLLAGAAPWPIILAAIPAALFVVVYAIVLGVDELARHSRSRLAVRAAEAAARASGQPLPPSDRMREPAPRKPLVYVPPKRQPRPPQN